MQNEPFVFIYKTQVLTLALRTITLKTVTSTVEKKYRWDSLDNARRLSSHKCIIACVLFFAVNKNKNAMHCIIHRYYFWQINALRTQLSMFINCLENLKNIIINWDLNPNYLINEQI